MVEVGGKKFDHFCGRHKWIIPHNILHLLRYSHLDMRHIWHAETKYGINNSRILRITNALIYIGVSLRRKADRKLNSSLQENHFRHEYLWKVDVQIFDGTSPSVSTTRELATKDLITWKQVLCLSLSFRYFKWRKVHAWGICVNAKGFCL